jgi:chaperonin GroES
MKIKPRMNQVAIAIDTPEQISDGGIVLPDRAQETRMTGVVKAVGPGALNDDLKPGDRVLFEPWKTVEMKIGKDTVHFLHSKNITAILVEE